MASDPQFYQLSAESTLRLLKSSRQGLSGAEAAKRLQQFGENKIERKKKLSALVVFGRQFTSPLTILLLVATGISVAIGYFIDAAVVGSILILNAILGFVQEYKAERAIEALERLTVPKTTVIRDGKQKVISSLEVVPGDILILNTGDKVTADGLLLEITNLKADESVLTGESVPAEKLLGEIEKPSPVAERKNCIFSNTTVVYGKCVAVAFATGMKTEVGKIATLIETAEEKATPLQNELAKTARTIGIIVVLIGAAVFGLGIWKGSQIFDMFLTAISLAVAAVPEGLPAVITIALSVGIQRMAKSNAVIRKLPAVETLGSCTFICTDKTGTLTKNEMTVKKIFVDGRSIMVTGEGYEPSGEFFIGNEKYNSKEKSFDLLLRICSLCNNSSLTKEDGRWSIIGDPTEAALVVAAEKAGLHNSKLKQMYLQVAELSFDAVRKRMSTVHTAEGKHLLFTKGAPDMLLDKCSHILKKGKIYKLTADERKKILAENEAMASSALRVLAAAYKPLKILPKKFAADELEQDLIFVGLVGMIDPPRPEALIAIREAESAGIKVAMVTGDHRLTAKAIGKQLDLVKPTSLILEGSELDAMSDAELAKVVENVSIFGRVSPEHKVRIVEALQKKGHIVAMTGDGVNDAPALKQADIGIAMGLVGTDVAKEASEMVLEDDNFSTIVAAVKEGRNIYNNIKNFINYLLTSNTGEVATIFAASLFALPLPLIAVQILWMNLLTDGLPALALGIDPPAADIMKRLPRSLKEKIIDNHMLVSMFLTAVLMAASSLGLYWLALQGGASVEKARTIVFATLVMFQIARVQAVRAEHSMSFFANKWLLAAIGLSISLLLAVIYFSPLASLFATEPLSLTNWLHILGLTGFGFVFLTAFGLLRRKN